MNLIERSLRTLSLMDLEPCPAQEQFAFEIAFQESGEGGVHCQLVDYVWKAESHLKNQMNVSVK